jgi:hypothetical protein
MRIVARYVLDMMLQREELLKHHAGCFHKIAVNELEASILDSGKQSMKQVAQLVEQLPDFVDAKKSGIPVRGPWVVHDQDG